MSKIMFVCTSCQARAPKWAGKCPQCGEWNTLEEKKESLPHTSKIAGSIKESYQIDSNQTGDSIRYTSSSSELDSVLGGWLSKWSLVLLSGEPGIGKSTLALQMSQWYANTDLDILYISGEEHRAQISGRAQRLGVNHENIRLLTENNFDDIFQSIEHSKADVVIIDSLSVLSSSSLDGVSGSISQIRLITESCMGLAKKSKKSIILIGHITKDGSIGGPKSLEHLVDVVLFLEWVRTENYRILRAFKNRFWPTDAVGIFRMESNGLIDMPNPWMEFIEPENFQLPGSALTLTLEWNRPILIEIEALTTVTKFGYPKRSSRWILSSKLDLLIAVMSKFTKSKLDSYDVYLNVARGLKITEPWVDLACIAALQSAKKWVSNGKTLYFWETSLTGVVKNVFLLEKRLYEAKKLGFDHAYIPDSYQGKVPKWMKCVRIKNIASL